MINRIDPRLNGYDNLNLQPKRIDSPQSGSIFRQALAEELDTQNPLDEGRPQLSTPVSVPETRPVLPRPTLTAVNAMAAERAKMMRQLEPMIHEVRQIAEDAGFIDVSSENVLKAYQSGQSFLADYRV